MNAKWAHTSGVTPTADEPYRSIKIGDYLLDIEGMIETEDRLNNWRHDTFNAIMTDGVSMNTTNPKLLFTNGLAQIVRSATHCNYAGDECWVVRVHPRIKTVSHNTGYSTGGQVVRIDGVQLNGTNIEVKVDGIDCVVETAEQDYITCVTGESSSESAIGYQPGQPGLTTIMTDEDYIEYLVLSSSMEVTNLNSSEPLSGWFKAPATAQYRFYITCDAACTLNMNYETPYDASNVNTTMPDLTVIAYLNY
jgi:hypothetical protein